MMSWENVNIKDNDRLAQAGVALVEQALFSDSSTFADSVNGHMAVGRNGVVQVDAGKREFVQTSARRDHDDNPISPHVWGQEVTKITDASGHTLQTIDQQWDGNMIDNVVAHQSPMNLIVKDGDGSLLFRMKGKALPLAETLNSSFGSFKEDTTDTVQDASGKTQPVQIHFTAVNKGGNVLDINATVSYVDANGQPIPGEDGKPKRPSNIELLMKIDPRTNSADFQLKKTGF